MIDLTARADAACSSLPALAISFFVTVMLFETW